MDKRQSNIELLRIISMLFILVVHFDGAALGLPIIMQKSDLYNLGTISKEAIEAISIIGVNCFVLISGYFGIRFSFKGLLSFTLWCLFYSVGIYIGVALIAPESFSVEGFINSFLIFSHTDLWFVPSYLGLYLLCPILNKGIENITKYQFQWTVVAIIFLNVYLGWWQDGKINPTGYNVMQMIMVYIIGRYIGLYGIKALKKRQHIIMWYVIFTSFIFTSAFFLQSTKAFAYNSPFVLGASVCFFLIFTTFELKNKMINYIASSAFAVYLIHKYPPIWGTLKKIIMDWASSLGYLEFTLYCILLIIATYTICIAIDKLRIYIMTPAINRLDTIFKKSKLGQL